MDIEIGTVAEGAPVEAAEEIKGFAEGIEAEVKDGESGGEEERADEAEGVLRDWGGDAEEGLE